MEAKLRNFRAYIEPLCVSEQQKALFATFKDVSSLTPYLLQALSLRAAGQLEKAIDELCKGFAAEDPAAFRVKVGRYITMFCDVMTS